LESECRRCGAKGHWKAECPLNRTNPNNASSQSSKDAGAFTGAVLADESASPEDDMIVLPSPRRPWVVQKPVKHPV
jgi:hypothetical protein